MKLGSSPSLRAPAVIAVLGLSGATIYSLVPVRPPLGEVRDRLAPPETPTTPSEDPQVPPLPETLTGTGLYADFASRTIADDNRPFTPQYPLWTDGATKRRWIHLPKGSAIDASTPDAWQFPVGTKLWKEFSFTRPAETRFIERTAAGWRFAAYKWSEDGETATLAPERGAFASEIAPGRRHAIPSVTDCGVCHGNGATPVLGFSALQLSTDRDPNAVHGEPVPSGALDLEALKSGGWLRGFSGSTSPRIAARTPIERSALGYLHANCGTCHRNEGGLASLEFVLASPSDAPLLADGGPIATTLDRPSRAIAGRMRIARRQPDRSLLVERMRSRVPVLQMPPLGTQLVDDEGVRLMTRWIDDLE
jgi:cytochrome c553